MVLQFVGEYVAAFLYWTPSLKKLGVLFFIGAALSGEALYSSPFFSEPQSEKIGVFLFIGATCSPPRRVGSPPFLFYTWSPLGFLLLLSNVAFFMESLFDTSEANWRSKRLGFFVLRNNNFL